MKLKSNSIAIALLLTATVGILAGEPAQPRPVTPEFDRLKTLVGTWKGKADIGQGPVEMTVEYRLLAGGTVLEERFFPGTANEMVTMYYEKSGTVALTHYCIMGNRPAMLLQSADAKTLTFDFDKSCGIDAAKESHMHAMTISFDGADTITTNCKAFIGGKEMETHATTLRRVKT
jgi:hypothetical protein